MNSFSAEVIERIESVVHSKERGFVGLHEPHFGDKELEYVTECVKTGWVSTAGAFVNRFEKDLAEYTGAKHVVATMNGTAALHLAMMVAGVERDDEVLVSTLTFVASVNAIHYLGAVPHFVDASEEHFGLDADLLENYLKEIAEKRSEGTFNKNTGRRIKAIMPVHIFGHPVEFQKITELAKEYDLKIVEDAAEGLGSFINNKHVGTLGDVGALSFNGNKIITTGGGGALLINDEEIATLARSLATTGKRAHTWEFYHDRVAFNYRLPNLNAALGCAQLEKLDDFIARKVRLYKNYQESFSGMSGVKIYKDSREHVKVNHWLTALILDEDKASFRDEIIETANQQGLGLRPLWTLMHKLPMNADGPKASLSVAESLEGRVINLPSSVFLAESLPQESITPV